MKKVLSILALASIFLFACKKEIVIQKEEGNHTETISSESQNNNDFINLLTINKNTDSRTKGPIVIFGVTIKLDIATRRCDCIQCFGFGCNFTSNPSERGRELFATLSEGADYITFSMQEELPNDDDDGRFTIDNNLTITTINTSNDTIIYKLLPGDYNIIYDTNSYGDIIVPIEEL